MEIRMMYIQYYLEEIYYNSDSVTWEAMVEVHNSVAFNTRMFVSAKMTGKKNESISGMYEFL